VKTKADFSLPGAAVPRAGSGQQSGKAAQSYIILGEAYRSVANHVDLEYRASKGKAVQRTQSCVECETGIASLARCWLSANLRGIFELLPSFAIYKQNPNASQTDQMVLPVPNPSERNPSPSDRLRSSDNHGSQPPHGRHGAIQR